MSENVFSLPSIKLGVRLIRVVNLVIGLHLRDEANRMQIGLLKHVLFKRETKHTRENQHILDLHYLSFPTYYILFFMFKHIFQICQEVRIARRLLLQEIEMGGVVSSRN